MIEIQTIILLFVGILNLLIWWARTRKQEEIELPEERLAILYD